MCDDMIVGFTLVTANDELRIRWSPFITSRLNVNRIKISRKITEAGNFDHLLLSFMRSVYEKTYKICKLCLLTQMHIFTEYKGRHEIKMEICYLFLIKGLCRPFRSTRVSHEALDFTKTKRSNESCLVRRWHRTVEITFT